MSSPRILVVDDESSLLLTLAANLDLAGFQVTEAASGAEALRILERESFDLVLSDIRMPGMSGVDLFRKARELHPDMPVILMTAFALEGIVKDAIQEGAFTVLPKPFDVDHLVYVLSLAARRPSVLVVDDDAPVAEATAAALAASGVRARAVFNGEEALAALEAGDIDLCVVDMVMPRLSGADVVERIRATHPGIACLAVSGHDVPAMFQRVARSVLGFMRKPVDPVGLVQAIASARGRKTP